MEGRIGGLSPAVRLSEPPSRARVRGVSLALLCSAMLCVACGKREAAPPEGRGAERASSSAEVATDLDPVDPETGVEASCGYVKRVLNPSPGALLSEHLKRDAAGTLMQSDPWLDASDDCPGHLPGPDVYTLIASYRIGALTQRKDSASATITFQRLGRVWSDSTFEVDTATVAHVVRMARTRYGWRIRHDRYPWLNVELVHGKFMRAHDRVVAARLARTMAREAATSATTTRTSPP